jgi:lipoprotein NlpI
MRASMVLTGVATLVILVGPVLVSRVVADDSITCLTGADDEKIAACTHAINSGRWSGSNLAWAYSSRGRRYFDEGDNDRAIADYSEMIRLKPKGTNVYDYTFRGRMYFAKGDNDRAIADFNEAIRLDPTNPIPYLHRGLSYLYSGNLTKALADLSQANELPPKFMLGALWLDIVGQRNNVPSRLAQAAKQLEIPAWEVPIISLFLGQSTPAAVLAAADDPDPTKKKDRVCRANFYSGEWALRQGSN